MCNDNFPKYFVFLNGLSSHYNSCTVAQESHYSLKKTEGREKYFTRWHMYDSIVDVMFATTATLFNLSILPAHVV